MSLIADIWHRIENINHNNKSDESSGENSVFLNATSYSDHQHNSFLENEHKRELSDRISVIFIVFEICVALFAIFGNLLVIVVFMKNRRVRRKTNFYIMSLACADFFVGFLGIPTCIFLVRYKFSVEFTFAYR